MSSTSHRPELDLLRRQVADLARELAERDRVLHEQTRHLEAAQALAHLGSWNWDIASGEMEWSDELYRIFGYEPRARAITFDSFVSAVLPNDHDRVLASIDDALAGAAAYDMECRIVRPDGDVRTIHCCGEVARDSGGQPLRMSGAALDITERKRAEAMVRTSQEKLRQALRASGTGLWDWNTETNEVSFSEEWKHQLGYEPAEIADSFEAWKTLLHPEDRDAAMAYVHDYVSHREGDYRQEFRLKHKDGGYRWIEARASFVTEADGRRISLLGSHADITDRKRMEESVRESEEWYRTLVELSPSGVFVFSEGRTAYVNHTGAVLLGANAAQEILDRPTFEFIHPDYHQEVRENVKRLLSGGMSVHSAERIYLKMDGTPIPVQVEAARITWNGKPAIIGLFSDITERKQAEEALRESEERFAIAFRASPHPIGITELATGRCVEVNDACLQLFGFRREEVIGSTTLMLGIWPNEEDRAWLVKQLKGGKPVHNFEMSFKVKSGDLRHILVSSDLAELNGRMCLITVGNDITERKRAEQALADLNATLERQVSDRTEALRRSEERFRQFFQNAPNVTCLKDHEGRYLYTNQRFEKVFRLAPGMALGKTDREVFSPAQAEQCELHDRQVLATGRGQEFEEVTEQEDGLHTSIVVKFPVTDAAGHLSAIGVIATDVTERNRAQEALRESEARWQQFAESVGSAFWIADVTPDERKVLYVNSAFTSIWGIEREEIYQNWFLWLDSIHPDDRTRVKADHDRFVGGGATAVFHCEYRIVGRDGYVRWILDRRTRMAGREHRIACIAEDITHLKQQLAVMAQTESIGNIGGWELDFLTNRLWWSDETYRLHETTPELYSPTVETALNFYTPESRPLIAEALEKAMPQGMSWDLELDLVSAKGRRLVVRAAGKVEVVNDRAVRAYGTFQDITERKRAEEALRQAHSELERKVIERTVELQTSEDRYARATAIGKVGVWELDVENGRYYGDANLKALFGYAPDELSTDPYAWLNLVHPDDQPIAMKNWELVQSGAVESSHYELRHIKKDGSIVWGDVRAHAVRDRKRQLTHLIGATVDITERKQAEQTLSESEARFRTLVANIPGAIYRCAVDREWTMSYLSNAIENIVGYPATEFIANHTRSYASVIHPDDRQLVEEATWTRLQEHRPYVIEYRLIHANGTVRWVYEKGQGVFTPNGDVRFLDGAIFDVTERKQAEQALRESEERFSKAFRTSPHPIGITEAATGRCIEVNDACLELFGFRREEVIGHTTLMLGIWPNLEERVRVIERLKAGQPVRNMEFVLKTKSGALRYLLTSADLAELNGTLCVVTVANDITERKRAEEALRMSEERFAKAFQASPHPVVISELDSGLVMDANDAACHLLAYRKEEVVGRTTQQIGLWPSTEARDCYLELLKRQGSVRNVEVELRSKSGEIRQCLLSSELIELHGKQCSVTVGDDITESKRLERALRLTQFSVDQAVEAIVWLDPNARIFSVNDTACQMLEYSREQLLAMTVHDIDANFPVKRWVTHWNYLKQQGALTFDAKFWSRTGLVLQTDVTVNYLQHEGKEYACMIMRDVAERKRAEAELRRSHTFLRQVIDTDPDLIFAKDRDGRFTMANKAVADWYGTTVEELIGKSDSDFNANAEEVEFFRRSDLEVIYSGRDRFIPEERLTDAEGKTRWLQTVKRPIYDDQGQVHMVLGAATDITERKRMEEILVQRERDLSAALQERERISQDLHDGILQSLYAVGLGLEACKPLIRKRRDPVAKKFMATLDHAIGQLNQVMSEVRNFIAGLESHVLQGGDFSSALRTMVETMSISSSTRCRVRIDDEAVRRLSTEQALHIINIVREGVSNALRHSRAKQITVSLRDLVRSDRLAVTDDGIGFNTRSVQGIGHGLVNMAARAQKVRGLFAIQSKPDKGTRVSLDLPKETPYAHT